jgi:hypothetical protein
VRYLLLGILVARLDDNDRWLGAVSYCVLGHDDAKNAVKFDDLGRGARNKRAVISLAAGLPQPSNTHVESNNQSIARLQAK